MPAAADGEEAQDQAEEGAGDGGRSGGHPAHPADDDGDCAGEGRDCIEVGPVNDRPKFPPLDHLKLPPHG